MANALWGEGLLGETLEPSRGDKLSGKFILPPFSVLSAREGYWQSRKRAWLSIGIQSELGRGAQLLLDQEGLTDEQKKKLAKQAKSYATELIQTDPRYGKDGKARGRIGYKHETKPVLDVAYQAYRPEEGGVASDDRNPLATPYTGRPLVSTTTASPGIMKLAGGFEEAATGTTGTSIFDPVLCELAYTWFAPPGGLIVDPFAGGSVRGVVASRLGFDYVGVDLSKPQVEANRVQGETLCPVKQPIWHCGDSNEIGALCQGVSADFVFSCPPYGSLEQYSDDPRDISTMTVDEFRVSYSNIINEACKLLKPNRFACFVIGDYRDKQGFYCNFQGVTVDAFERAGLRLYNEAILVTAAGSLPIRVSAQFPKGRKLGRSHQTVLVFCKGDPRKAAEACKQDLGL